MIAWHCIGNTILDILRAVVRQGLGKDIAEPRAEHNDELLGEGGELWHQIQAKAILSSALTAISALSASTYSCGGDGNLFGKGGEAGGLIASGFGAGLKYLFSPVG